MSRSHRFVSPVPWVLAATLIAGCVVGCSSPPPPPPPDTQIGFEPSLTFSRTCDGALTTWQVADRADPAHPLTRPCDQSAIFGGLTPGASYTFDISGYSNDQLCWQGSCAVPTEYGILTWADCRAAIDPLCGK
jgi:hypothetical protein